MLTMIPVVLAAGSLAILALAGAYVLGWAKRAFYVKVDPQVEAILAVLPGANCGGCGFVGCEEYAQATARGDALPDLCTPGGNSTAQAIAAILGVEVSVSFPYRAVTHCSARREDRLQQHEYLGERTCAAANLVQGVQGCTYGCLGFGDCVRACNYDAIHIIEGTAVVDYSRCVGCKACAKACPRNIITMVPFKTERMLVVGCANKDMGNDVKAVCNVGCIGCKACERLLPDLFKMEDNVPVINYDNYDPEKTEELQPVLEKCPRESLVFVGTPTEAQMDVVKDEELPDRVQADFKTTVDDTEWRG